jgi:CRISPR-associated protein Cmr1
MAWTTIHLEVTTPLFNGGAEHKDEELQGAERRDSELRVPSLRGAMRFWFRALAGMALGPDLDALARAEAAVFGRPTTAGTTPTPPRR